MLAIIKTVLMALCLSLMFTACSYQPNMKHKSLYEQLGGQSGVDAIVDSFIQQIGKDKQILPYFADAHISHFREQITLHFCMIADGPCQYDGDSMIDIHTGMNITERDFNRVVDLLIIALNEQHIAHRIQNKLLARLAPLRSEIIYL